MATKRFVSKDNLGRVWARLFGKVLNSREEIEANTSENMIAGADAVKEVYSSLGGLKFGTDGDGNCGYYGADGSLIPFKSGALINFGTVSLNKSAATVVSGIGYKPDIILYYNANNTSGDRSLVIWHYELGDYFIGLLNGKATKKQIGANDGSDLMEVNEDGFIINHTNYSNVTVDYVCVKLNNS